MPRMPILTANIINFLLKLLASVRQIVPSKTIPMPKYFFSLFHWHYYYHLHTESFKYFTLFIKLVLLLQVDFY